MLVSMLNIQELDGHANLEVTEFFAGTGRLCRLAKSVGLPCEAHDLSYDESKSKSAMDINGNAGYLWLSPINLIPWCFCFKYIKNIYIYTIYKYIYIYDNIYIYIFNYIVLKKLYHKGFLHHSPKQWPPFLRLALSAIVRSKFGAMICLMGVVCSSWVTINAGTSLRTWLAPMGNPEVESVRIANKMVARLGDNLISIAINFGSVVLLLYLYRFVY